MQGDLTQGLGEVTDRIRRAAERYGRDFAEIKLVAVSKTHPANVLKDAMAAGLRVFGENKVQEAEGKIEELGRSAAEWHLIGHLQANKARKAVRLFDVIHTVDSVELAQRLDRICDEEGRAALSVLIQVDLAGEATKAGVTAEQLQEVIDGIAACKRLHVSGLMLIPPYFEDTNKVRPYFARLRDLRDAMLPGGDLSMGMSHDFEAAIAEGSTIVRIGTAIFGMR